MDIREQIDAYIKQKQFEIVSRTCDLVKIPSLNTEDDSGKPYGRKCAEALGYLSELCKEKKLWVKNLDDRCLEVKCQEEQSGKRLVIATHADVVPTEDENIYDPFCGSVYGDYIIGRGSVDNKGPLMATLYALAFFKECNIPLQNDIRLFFGSNEECGMDDLEYYLSKVGMPDWGLSVDDDFPTVNGEKGLIQFTLSALKSAHVESIQSYGSRQRMIHDFCEIIIDGKHQIVERSSEITNPVLSSFTCSEVPLFADEAHNRDIRALMLDGEGRFLEIDYEDEMSGKTKVTVIAAKTVGDKIEVTFDARLPVSRTIEETVERLEAYAVNHGFGLHIRKTSMGYYKHPDHPIVKLLTDTYNQEANANEKPYVMSACTYARVFENGCGFGCGDPHEVKPFPNGHGGCHGPDEAHKIQVLLDAVRYLILGIKAIDDQWSAEQKDLENVHSEQYYKL